MKNAHKLTEGALFLAIFAVLLLITIYIPVLGVVVNLFIPLPFIMFSAKNDRKSRSSYFWELYLFPLSLGRFWPFH